MHRTLTKAEAALLARFPSITAEFAEACRFSREHVTLAAEACETYGGHGTPVSGCVRSHFPDDMKNRLRLLAIQSAEASGRGFAARPARVRTSTMRRIAQLVATRDGSGFYGPQPIR
jgi:hypothetical protein